ncbi:class I lanthipeptide [Spirosoma oryzicola]|uniref:class I lanthipeptide n=1 Tax=Spirosoma oryzicola TaxID=2898794 RepID=UPI001E4910F7|nr:class I lanthipeptide [Spirosoma oryzicola]UHG94932.1 class I lanthipeptide [Spirosoma oryzicola]
MKKKIDLIGKLSLDKETVSRLDEAQLKALVGGATVKSISCNGGAANVESDEDETLEVESCCNNSCNGGVAA